jgi:hypothetical protein
MTTVLCAWRGLGLRDSRPQPTHSGFWVVLCSHLSKTLFRQFQCKLVSSAFRFCSASETGPLFGMYLRIVHDSDLRVYCDAQQQNLGTLRL